MKTTRFYTHASRIIRWDSDMCMHGAKCLKCVLLDALSSGEITIAVTEEKFNEILNLASYCPAKALRLVE